MWKVLAKTCFLLNGAGKIYQHKAKNLRKLHNFYTFLKVKFGVAR